MEKIEYNSLEWKVESAHFFNDKYEDVYKRNIMHYSHTVAYESILTLTTEIFYGYTMYVIQTFWNFITQLLYLYW